MTSMNEEHTGPGKEVLDEVVRRIVGKVHPLKIILFGSAARGDAGRESDLDLLVVMPEGIHRRSTATEVYRSLRGIGVPKDVIVVTDRDVREHGNNPSLVLKPALEEGRELYAAD